MSETTSQVLSLYEHPDYLAGCEAYATGKHLIVPDGAHRDAWTLGWNDEFRNEHERDPS